LTQTKIDLGKRENKTPPTAKSSLMEITGTYQPTFLERALPI